MNEMWLIGAAQQGIRDKSLEPGEISLDSLEGQGNSWQMQILIFITPGRQVQWFDLAQGLIFKPAVMVNESLSSLC